MFAVSPAVAEPPRASGASTGDGSTPFTGLAQAPEANLFVGAATTSIPIEVPPGRKNLTPKLALTYSSNGGPSPYGYGWDLPLGKIQRSTKHGVPLCTDRNFVVVLPAANVECTLGNDNICVPQLEESFLQIQYLPDDNRWEVWDKSGLYYLFGRNYDSRTGSYVAGLFKDYGDPIGCGFTFSWGLSRIEDTNSNYVEVEYETDSLVGLPLRDTLASYPKYIRWGGHPEMTSAYLFQVEFDWDSRPQADWIVNSSGGFAMTLVRRLNHIVVKYGSKVVRTYSLNYNLDYNELNPDGRIGRQSFLVGVTLRNGRGQALPATTFLYHENNPANGQFGFSVQRQDSQKPTTGFDFARAGRRVGVSDHDHNTTRDILDMDGDGIADLVDTNGSALTHSWRVYKGTSAGFDTSNPIYWAVPNTLPYEVWECHEEFYPGTLMRHEVCGYVAETLGGWALQSSHDTAGNPSSLETREDTFDISGDGIVDHTISTTHGLYVFLGRRDSNGSWGFDIIPKASSEGCSFALFPSCESSLMPPGPIRRTLTWPEGSRDDNDFIDLNGDGLLDKVQSNGTSNVWSVWYNTPQGFQDAVEFSASGGLRFTTQEGVQTVGIYDINGDGLPDQIFTDGSTWHVDLNRGDHLDLLEDWSVPPACAGGLSKEASHEHENLDIVRDFFDINGDGLPDIVDASNWGTTGKWTVCLNVGNGFLPYQGGYYAGSYQWPAPFGVIRDLKDHGDYCVNDNEYCHLDPGTLTFRTVFDVDGDGLVDFVDFGSDPEVVPVFWTGG
jgi:hypothetical protein